MLYAAVVLTGEQTRVDREWVLLAFEPEAEVKALVLEQAPELGVDPFANAPSLVDRGPGRQVGHRCVGVVVGHGGQTAKQRGQELGVQTQTRVEEPRSLRSYMGHGRLTGLPA